MEKKHTLENWKTIPLKSLPKVDQTFSLTWKKKDKKNKITEFIFILNNCS